MIERIGTAVTAQSKPISSAKAAEEAKSEQPAVQANDVRKRDRLVLSSEASRYGSPDDPMARKAFDKAHNAAQAND